MIIVGLLTTLQFRLTTTRRDCILTVLSKQPNWIGAEITKGNKAFSDSLPIGFDEKNKDCLKEIKHNIGYENWEKDLYKYLTQP